MFVMSNPRSDGAALANLGVARGRDFPGSVRILGDYSADTFAGQVRALPDDATLVAAMTVATPVFDGEYTSFDMTITDTVLAGGTVPAPSRPGANVVLYWDLERTSGGIKTTFLHGTFTIFGRVTQ